MKGLSVIRMTGHEQYVPTCRRRSRDVTPFLAGYTRQSDRETEAGSGAALIRFGKEVVMPKTEKIGRVSKCGGASMER